MLDIPEEIKALFRENNLSLRTKKKFKLSFYEDKIDTLYPYETLWPSEDLFPTEHEKPWLVIEDDRIESESLTITESLSESEDLEFGSCESAVMEIVVADVVEDVTGKEFTLTVEIGGYEMAMGIYTVGSFVRQADRRKRKITAYDRMRWFDTDVADWYNSLNFPTTLGRFRKSLCDHIGITQAEEILPLDSMEVTKTIEPKEISGLDVLKAICQINGVFGHIDKTGTLIFIKLQTTGLYPAEDLFPDENLFPAEFGGDGEPVEHIFSYKQGMTYEDYVVEEITGLSIRQEEGDIGANVGDGYSTYAVEGNFLVYGKTATDLLNIALTLLPQISGRIYRPANIECVGMPWVEVGDALRIITRDDIVETFVMKRITKGCQAMTDNFQSTGSQKREEVFGINKQVTQLEGKTAIIIKNVEEVSVRLTDLKKQEEAHFKITSDAITAEVKRASEAEASLKVQADAITLDVKNFKDNTAAQFKVTSDRITSEVQKLTAEDGKLSSRITQTEKEISLKVSKGNVSSQLSVESGGVNITGNRLTWSATNSSMTANGTLTCNNIVATNGTFSGAIKSNSAEITGGTINLRSGAGWDSLIELTDGDVVSLFTGGTVQVKNSSRGTLIYPTQVETHIIQADRAYFEDLSVSGNKNRVVKTPYGDTLLYSYETASPMFGDVGCGGLDEDGLCYIFFDPIFVETIAAGTYQVFLQKEGMGDIWVAEKTPEYFLAKGTPGLLFSWEAKAKQAGYELERLEAPAQDWENDTDYGYLAQQYLNDYEKEIMEVKA